VCSEMKKVINAQFFTNRRKLEQNKILISTILLSSFPCSNYRQLIVINNKIRQYEKIVLCDQLMLNYCRTDIHKCFLER
jgi:hypothetical protein